MGLRARIMLAADGWAATSIALGAAALTRDRMYTGAPGVRLLATWRTRLQDGQPDRVGLGDTVVPPGRQGNA